MSNNYFKNITMNYQYSQSVQTLTPAAPANAIDSTSIQLNNQSFTSQSTTYGNQMIRQEDSDINMNKPDDFYAWSLVNAIFFNLFIGIVAVIFSVMTRNRNLKNQLILANQTSKYAFILNLVATVIGSIYWITGLIIIIFAARF